MAQEMLKKSKKGGRGRIMQDDNRINNDGNIILDNMESNSRKVEEVKPIVYVKRGVANSFDDRIEIHEKWKAYPLIESELIKHERGHDSGKFTKNDLQNDFKSFVGFKMEMFSVFLVTPSMWWQLSPIFWSSYDNKLYWDKLASTFWAIILFLIILFA